MAEDVRTERMATGGEAVARLDDGRVVFVRGSMPDETVRVEITEEKKRFARGVVTEVLEPAVERIEMSCVHAEHDCGGCDWMHISLEAQDAYKLGIVVEQLERLGGVTNAPVTALEMPRGRRTTVRCAVSDGRAGYRMRRSSESFAAESCQAAHPLLEELIVEGRFGDATEVTLRVGAATGERMVLTNGSPALVDVPDSVLVVRADAPGDAAIHEEVAGRLWRISAESFFQTSHEGAEALVAAVSSGLGESSGPIVDLYGGVGLLGGGAAWDRIACSVESSPASSADAAHNLDAGVTIVKSRVEQWKPSSFPTVIADPARRGLGKQGVKAIEGTSASRLVLVSCDPASLGRDAALLKEQGWRYDQGKVINMFPDTSRIEAVSTFVR